MPTNKCLCMQPGCPECDPDGELQAAYEQWQRDIYEDMMYEEHIEEVKLIEDLSRANN